MILIRTEFVLVSLFTAQLEEQAWTPRICFRYDPYSLSMGFLSCFSANKSLAENLYGKKEAPNTSQL